MMFEYDSRYQPPAPVTKIWLSYPEKTPSVGPLLALIDTGADGTLAPIAVLEKLNAPMIDLVRIRSQWGEWRYVEMFTVDLTIGDILLPAIEVVGIEEDEIVLGRNVLNRLILLLNGIEQFVNITT